MPSTLLHGYLIISTHHIHGAPVISPFIPLPTHLHAALAYGIHCFALNNTRFVQAEILDQVLTGHIAVFPWIQASTLQYFLLLTLGSIPQAKRQNCLFYNYTYSAVNHHICFHALPEATQFGRTMYCILKQIALAEPKLGLIYMAKVDLANACMYIWI
eukprot:3752715-Ditylum_brightwellii.AAC.1